ncbi:MAG: hypothetical protein EHM17_09810 [Verrucomicrobiaceae bacterium]|nr:MAG: hypothetical protein EHM17_09810 [Verrucomicrobiaceae bacterium]
MELFLIDAIGPFFRGKGGRRKNWSKIPFTSLEAGDWPAIEEDLRRFAEGVSRQGYNAVTLDDLAHLAPHPLHEPQVAERIAFMRERFARIFRMLHDGFGLKIYLTSDVLPLTAAIDAAMGDDPAELDRYYQGLVRAVLDDFPELAGLILRIGESDGKDVKDPVRTRLHLRTAPQTNGMLRALLPEFEARGRDLIFRTWTVGAHPIGDLMWHRDTLAQTLEGLDSPSLIVSMKHGESDFFRHLPLNRAFFRVKQRKLVELQARREYEGAGGYPSFIGGDCERLARYLTGVENMAGISVWCQTGGWHRFGRRAFLEGGNRDIWIRLNTAAAIAVFKHHQPAENGVLELLGPQRALAAVELLGHADTVIRELLYIPEFARQKLFFRRVRIPPLLHVYWDTVFINRATRGLLRHFVRQPESALRGGEMAARLFTRMMDLAQESGLPVDDIEHMRDLFKMLLLARSYYFLADDPAMAARIREAKRAYKARWPRERRYRIKVSFAPVPLGPRSIAIGAALLLRRKRGYRWLDRLFVLHGLGPVFNALMRCDPRVLPKFLRKSAMGVDTLFK